MPKDLATPHWSQAPELVSNEAFQSNDVERALVQAFLRMDELLVKVCFGWKVGPVNAQQRQVVRKRVSCCTLLLLL